MMMQLVLCGPFAVAYVINTFHFSEHLWLCGVKPSRHWQQQPGAYSLKNQTGYFSLKTGPVSETSKTVVIKDKKVAKTQKKLSVYGNSLYNRQA